MVDQACNPNDLGDGGRRMVMDLRPAWSTQRVLGQLEYSEALKSQLTMKESQGNKCSVAVAFIARRQIKGLGWELEIRIHNSEAGEMAHRIQELAAKPGDLRLILRTHLVERRAAPGSCPLM